MAKKVGRSSPVSTPCGFSGPSSQSPAKEGAPIAAASWSAKVDLPVPGKPVKAISRSGGSKGRTPTVYRTWQSVVISAVQHASANIEGTLPGTVDEGFRTFVGSIDMTAEDNGDHTPCTG